MLGRFKKIVLPVLLGLFMFSLVDTTIFTQNEYEVHASIPTIKVEGGEVNIDQIKPKGANEFFNTSLEQYRKVIVFISGIGTLSMILFFILNFINLGKSRGNPQERQKAVTGLIIAGIATAGLGSVTLITSLFYNML